MGGGLASWAHMGRISIEIKRLAVAVGKLIAPNSEIIVSFNFLINCVD